MPPLQTRASVFWPTLLTHQLWNLLNHSEAYAIRKKLCGSEKFLIEIQIELDNQIHEFLSLGDIFVHSTEQGQIL